MIDAIIQNPIGWGFLAAALIIASYFAGGALFPDDDEDEY
jgi:hypothetical protein